MGFWASLKLLIETVPTLIRYITELVGWLKLTFGEDPQKVMQEQIEAIQKLKEAKTPDEKLAAASKLSRIIHKL